MYPKIIETNSFKISLTRIKTISIYWNKVYEPDYLKFDEYLLKVLKDKKIHHKRFKGNILNEIDEVKMMERHSRYLHLFGERQKNIILRKYLQKKKK